MPTLEEKLARAEQRLKDVSGGVERIKTKIEADPGSVRVKGWMQRLKEYKDSLEGLPLEIGKLQLEIRKRDERLAARKAAIAEKADVAKADVAKADAKKAAK